MSVTVRIPWTRDNDNVYRWNEVCAWAIEMFGLPGEKFTTHANVDYMDWVFNNKHDALIFSLAWNGQFIEDEQLTVEHIAKLL